MKYKCTNKKCDLFDQEKTENLHLIFPKKGSKEEIIDKNINCPSCGKPRESKKEDRGLCTTVSGQPNVPSH